MYSSYPHHSRLKLKEIKAHKNIQSIEYKHNAYSLYKIKAQVHCCGSFAVSVGSEGRQHRRYTGSHFGAYDYRHGCRIRHGHGKSKSLQNTDGCGGRLYDHCEKHAYQKAQRGIGKTGQKLGKRFVLSKRSNRSAHGIHAEHQNGKPEQNRAHILFLVGMRKHI